MIYPDTPLVIWCQQHRLTPKKFICPLCDKEYETIIPVVARGQAGLESIEHECGDYLRKVLFVPTPSGLITKEYWQNTLKELS